MFAYHHPAARQSRQGGSHGRSEEHTSELQSQSNLVCRLLLEKKKRTTHEAYSTMHQQPKRPLVGIMATPRNVAAGCRTHTPSSSPLLRSSSPRALSAAPSPQS